MTVLGISIGTVCTGICVLEDGKVVDANIHWFTDPITDTKLTTIIRLYRDYVRKHHVDAIMVKIPPDHTHSVAVQRLMRRIGTMAKKHYCLYDFITKNEMAGILELATSKEIPAKAKELFPELTFRETRFNKKVYGAVLAADIYTARLIARASQQLNEQ